MKTTIAAFVLILAPGLAAAQCVGAEHKAIDTAMSCVEGAVYDPETQTCVPAVTG